LKQLLSDIRSCTVCAAHLPHGVRPIIQASSNARILIIGQAPGSKVHGSGIPWDDLSGKELRRWMGMDDATFYDAQKVALMPMGFCYPGKGKSGDLPPRKECAPLWHAKVLEGMTALRLTILIGAYAQQYYLGTKAASTITETVKNYKNYLPQYLPLVHPSPRNNIWQRKNLWFEKELVPMLPALIEDCLK